MLSWMVSRDSRFFYFSIRSKDIRLRLLPEYFSDQTPIDFRRSWEKSPESVADFTPSLILSMDGNMFSTPKKIMDLTAIIIVINSTSIRNLIHGYVYPVWILNFLAGETVNHRWQAFHFLHSAIRI